MPNENYRPDIKKMSRLFLIYLSALLLPLTTNIVADHTIASTIQAHPVISVRSICPPLSAEIYSSQTDVYTGKQPLIAEKQLTTPQNQTSTSNRKYKNNGPHNTPVFNTPGPHHLYRNTILRQNPATICNHNKSTLYFLQTLRI